jgi:hypothetical protein
VLANVQRAHTPMVDEPCAKRRSLTRVLLEGHQIGGGEFVHGDQMP